MERLDKHSCLCALLDRIYTADINSASIIGFPQKKLPPGIKKIGKRNMTPYGKTVESFEEVWATLQIKENELHFSEKGTILSSIAIDENARFTLSKLPKFVFASKDNEDNSEDLAELDLRKTIGEGGMGVIQLAIQLPLNREVAVKRVRQEKQSPETMMALLREAWVTGSLEHPNIIPVHTLGSDEIGSPMFVMKRISGEPWSELLKNPDHPLCKEHKGDLLRWHLEIFMQLCRAVHFAHSRGILHRDLKPENVMIGSFGEVYLLDWGIAVTMLEDEPLPIPRARDSTEIAGTPAYMAPEQAMGRSDLLEAATDVYLLGAILHEIVTERPRHIGNTLMEVLFSAYMSEPFPYPESISEELGKICNRAMHVEPAERFESAEALRKSIDHFLQHRDSIQLTMETQDALSKLKEMVAEEKTRRALEENEQKEAALAKADSESTKEKKHNAAHILYRECRFGFQHALRTWEKNQKALDGLQESYIAITEFEILQEDYKAASLYFPLISEPSEEIRQKMLKLAEQLESEQKELQELKKLEQDVSLRIGSRTRSFLSFIIALVYTPVLFSFSNTCGIFEFSYTAYFVMDLLFVLFCGVATIWARDTMFKTSVNRSILGTVWCLGLGMLLQTAGLQAIGVSPTAAITQLFLLYAIFTSLLAVVFEMRIMYATVVQIVAFMLSVMFPYYVFEIAAIFNFVALIIVSMVWNLEEIHNKHVAFVDKLSKKAPWLVNKHWSKESLPGVKVVKVNSDGEK